MSLYDALRELPLHIEEVVTDVHVYRSRREFTRKTTVVHLRPEPYFRHIGPEGLGEDVTYDADEHEPHRWPWIDLLGDWTLESFSAHLDEVDLFPAGEPQQPAYRDYRRWAFESAALDLALKQARLSTGDALEPRVPRPVTFVSSTRATVARRLARALPRPALQARPDARVDGRGASPSSPAAATSTSST